MGYYCGITTDLERRKAEHKRKHPNLRNWEDFSFPSREKAQQWEDKQTDCEHHPGGQEPNNPLATWYGYKFQF